MELKILNIGDKGNLSDERIGFKVIKDCQLSNYIVVKTYEVNKSTFYHISDSAYWFLPQEVMENDKVVLYSKKGKNSIIENADGTKTYFFYWGLINPIFNTEKDKVVLVNANNWDMNE
jgi:hypothetical protein